MTTPTSYGESSSIHASAVMIGDRAVLIRGPSGAGKSRLAFELILAGRAGRIPAATLVGDDRVRLIVRQGCLMVSPAAELAGLIEVRGLGIRHIEHAAEAIVGVVIDLAADDAERLPPPRSLQITLEGISLQRVPVAAGWDAFPLVAAHVLTAESYETIMKKVDCRKGFGNHIRLTLATD